MNGPVAGSPRISVLIPCFEDAAYVERAVASVREDEAVEIVVADDGSQDPLTLEALDRIAERGAVVVRSDENRGVTATRNAALAASSGAYVFTLDADDLAVAGRIAEMADMLDADPSSAVCYGDFLEFGGHLLLRAVPDRIDPYRVAYVNEYPQTALYRRSVIERFGGWTRVWEGLDARSDWNLWMTLAEEGQKGTYFGPRRPTYLYRIGDPRLAMRGRRFHPEIYEALRSAHPKLFGEIGRHRRETDLGLVRRYLYPVLYGRRALRPWEAEPRVKRVLDDLGIWTLQHRLDDDERRSFQRLVAASESAPPAR